MWEHSSPATARRNRLGMPFTPGALSCAGRFMAWITSFSSMSFIDSGGGYLVPAMSSRSALSGGGKNVSCRTLTFASKVTAFVFCPLISRAGSLGISLGSVLLLLPHLARLHTPFDDIEALLTPSRNANVLALWITVAFSLSARRRLSSLASFLHL